jgi:YHS domain-containing protein
MRSAPYSAVRRPRMMGLHGYSPVALVASKQWVHGDPRFAMDYKGIVYQFTSADEFRRFRETPERFAPQILGCDPVILDITDRAVTGDIRYAAFFDGELFLFVSDKSRQFFEQDPERFVRTKHVLNVDELDDKRLE